MRILHVCQPTDGGAAVVVRQLARFGVQSGDDVTVVCPADGPLSQWCVDAGATWVELPLVRAPSSRDLRNVAALRRLLPRFDVAHLHSSKAGAVGRLAAFTLRRSRRPGIAFTPHAWSWCVGGRAAGVYRAFERLAARVTDVVTVVSRDELTDGERTLPHATSFRLIENGVDTDDFRPSDAEPHTGPALIVQVGRLSTQKGQDRTIHALAAVDDRDSRLRFVGDGPDRDELEALARQLGVRERVEFVGNADPRPHLHAADVVVLPSRWEGMSLALLEAMAAGCAIVSTDCGGSDALGDAGIVITGRGEGPLIADLTRALNLLSAHPDLRADFARKARKRAVDEHSLSATLEHYRQLWTELSNRRGS